MKTGIELIEIERYEQTHKHGFSLQHDRRYYRKGQLLKAAAYCLSLAFPDDKRYNGAKWPWRDLWFRNKIKYKDRVGQLKVAGAFFIAETERTDSKPRYQKDVLWCAQQIDIILSPANR